MSGRTSPAMTHVPDPPTDKDRWAQAFNALVARIEAHPLFPKLVREVAVADQPSMPGYHWFCRNSRTFGSWVTRAMPCRRKGGLRRRARSIESIINNDLDLDVSINGGMVYGTALRWVRARRFPADGSDA